MSLRWRPWCHHAEEESCRGSVDSSVWRASGENSRASDFARTRERRRLCGRDTGHAMLERHALVVDDLAPKREYLRSHAAAELPRGTIIHTAATSEQGLAISRTLHERGVRLFKGIIDYDIDERNGADVIRAIRRDHPRAQCILATARTEGDSFEEAEGNAMAAGADSAFSTYSQDFERRFGAALAA